MKVEGDIVIVEEWQFEIDRDTLEIKNELGQITKEDMLKPTIIKVETEYKNGRNNSNG